MKKLRINILSLIASILALSSVCLSSCQDEPAAPEQEPTIQNPMGARFLSVKVRTTSDELFDNDSEYVDGADYEHAIDLRGDSEHVIIYFDKEYNYQGYSPLEFDKLSVEGTTSSGEAEEVAFIGFMKPKLDDFFTMPEYGLLILNAYDVRKQLDSLNERSGVVLNDVLCLMDSSTGNHLAGQSGEYFTMSSSAYLSKDGEEWLHSILFEIDKLKVFTSRTQAIMQPAAVAYVERMSSKFTLTLPGADGGKGLDFTPDDGRAQVIVCRYINGEPNYNNHTWTLTVEGWGINKYEPHEYYFRNIVPDYISIAEYPYTFGSDINSAGQPFFNGWNRAKDHRVFWSVDPNYYDGIFPVQYRAAVDNTNIEYFGKSGAPSLAYLSYDDLCKELDRIDDDCGISLYSTENTFPDTRMPSGGLWQHNLAGSELVVGARMNIQNLNRTNGDYDLYRNRIGVFYPSKLDFAYYFVTTFNNQLNSQAKMTFRYYDWANPKNNGEPIIHTQDITYGDYKLYYKDAPLTPAIMASLTNISMPALIENGDGKVIPWIEGMYIGRREKDPNTYQEIGDIHKLIISDNDFKSLIYDWIGAFDHFNGGRMTYSTPIVYKADQQKASGQNYRPSVGDYGVVRNASYSLAVQSINAIGTPVDNLSQPIIPYQTSLENSIMTEIKVFDWHIFSTDVTLPGL